MRIPDVCGGLIALRATRTAITNMCHWKRIVIGAGIEVSLHTSSKKLFEPRDSCPETFFGSVTYRSRATTEESVEVLRISRNNTARLYKTHYTCIAFAMQMMRWYTWIYEENSTNCGSSYQLSEGTAQGSCGLTQRARLGDCKASVGRGTEADDRKAEVKPSELRSEQRYMRFRQKLPQMQAAMRKRWAKRRAQEQYDVFLRESFRDRFMNLCHECKIHPDRALAMWYKIMLAPIEHDARMLRVLREEYGGGFTPKPSVRA